MTGLFFCASGKRGFAQLRLARAARDFGKFRFCGPALQCAEMGVDKNRPHLQLPLFLRTCLPDVCSEGVQKQCAPKPYSSIPRTAAAAAMPLSDAPIFFAIEAERPGSILRINRRFARFVLKLRRSDCLYASSCGAGSNLLKRPAD